MCVSYARMTLVRDNDQGQGRAKPKRDRGPGHSQTNARLIRKYVTLAYVQKYGQHAVVLLIFSAQDDIV